MRAIEALLIALLNAKPGITRAEAAETMGLSERLGSQLERYR
jgi:hypothetical protein